MLRLVVGWSIALVVVLALALTALVLVPKISEAVTATPVATDEPVTVGDESFAVELTVPAGWLLVRPSEWTAQAATIRSPDHGMTLTARTTADDPFEAFASADSDVQPIREILRSGLLVWHFANPDAPRQPIAISIGSAGPTLIIEVSFADDVDPAKYQHELALLLDSARVVL